MNIALIGSGGREHALCKKIYDSNKKGKIYCIPGNAGTANIAENLDVDFLNFKKLLKIIKIKKIKLVIIGPEQPLVNGLVDFLQRHKIRVFGPSKYAARLEGSKAFMKNLCKQNKIPTAAFKICKNIKDVKFFLNLNKMPIVVKADGLAAGKGVTICNTKKHVLHIAEEIFLGKFKTSRQLVLEEFIDGEELSYFLIVDKKKFLFFGSAQDHKKVGINETGPNTGGMGSYSPAPILTKTLENKVIKKIVKPTLNALKRVKKPYTGFLYVGLMIKNNEPYLIEYNVRMGDPECQTILPKLKTDLLDIILACTEKKLAKTEINWHNQNSLCIVLCSKGYPDKYQNNILIKNLDQVILKSNQKIYHAGTRNEKNNFFSNGGRVLNFVSLSNNFKDARDSNIEMIEKVNWAEGFYRKDIGYKVIK